MSILCVYPLFPTYPWKRMSHTIFQSLYNYCQQTVVDLNDEWRYEYQWTRKGPPKELEPGRGVGAFPMESFTGYTGTSILQESNWARVP